MPAYPMQVGFATGAFVNSRVVICGGLYPFTSQCYSLGQNETAWKPSGNLTTPRWGAASVEMDNKLVIFGGYLYDHLNATEEIDAETGTVSTGPTMPLGIAWHCAVKLNSTTALIIGGDDGSSYLRSSYFYDVKAKTFTSGPLLMEGRRYHGCSILNTGTDSFVVVAGGYNGTYMDSTEVMDLNEPTMWKTGS